MERKVSFADVLRAAAFLLENPGQWEEFKQRFGLEIARAAVKLAEQNGLPPDMLVKMKADLGLD